MLSVIIIIENPVSGGFTAHESSGKLRQGFALSLAGDLPRVQKYPRGWDDHSGDQ